MPSKGQSGKLFSTNQFSQILTLTSPKESLFRKSNIDMTKHFNLQVIISLILLSKNYIPRNN